MNTDNQAIIIYLDNCMVLSKKKYSNWREVQDEFWDNYKANLELMSCEEIISFFEEDFKEEINWPFSCKTIVDFFKSDKVVIQSERQLPICRVDDKSQLVGIKEGDF
ncbi:MAG: hypothetical protein PHQ72_09580 [Hespellia sp.]|nr:hypothetical protein [Hespellia sp.]